MRIYTDGEGWSSWDFDRKAVHADVTVLRAWAEKQITTSDAAFRMSQNNGWPMRPTNEQFKEIAAALGYFQWMSPYEESGG